MLRSGRAGSRLSSAICAEREREACLGNDRRVQIRGRVCEWGKAKPDEGGAMANREASGHVRSFGRPGTSYTLYVIHGLCGAVPIRILAAHKVVVRSNPWLSSPVGARAELYLAVMDEITNRRICLQDGKNLKGPFEMS